ncbi:MAG TPA: MBL fold metallo-hydrolase [Nitrolancea sp.]|nr:MBL fold metallo-hydrolase [Nitrolancea sp.]
MANAVQLEPGLFLIDLNFQGVPGVIGSYLLAGDGELALIETGPTSTIDALLAGVCAAGFAPEDISQLLVTHIHLDHAGAAGALLQRLPRARLLVHPQGAPHMIDPTRLLASAARIFGENLLPLWGEFVPAPADRVEELPDEARVRVAGRELVALHTPGHAYHHIAYWQPENGTLFTGDVAGVRLGGAPYVRPPTVPPELDLELWQESVTRMRGLAAKRLYLTHFGGYDDIAWHLDDLLARLFFWAGWAGARLQAEPDTPTLTRELGELGDAEIVAKTGRQELVMPYEIATAYQMTIDGMARYFRKRWAPRGGAR